MRCKYNLSNFKSSFSITSVLYIYRYIFIIITQNVPTTKLEKTIIIKSDNLLKEKDSKHDIVH